MRRTATHSHTRSDFVLPRGWIVLGAALASWLVVATMWTGMSQVYGLVASVI